MYEPRTLDEASFAALAAQGVRGIKLFLAYRELGMDADDDVLLRALLWGRAHGVVPRLHCENAGAVQVLRERLRAAGDLGVAAHPRSRPPLVEEEGIRRALDLARLADAPVYIVHVSTAGGVAAIREARAAGVAVTGETCPQYLLLDDGVYAGPAAAMGVISPPLRPRAHVEAIWEGVLDGTLTAVGSDHSHRGARPSAPFDEIVSGGPGVAARMPLILTAALRDARLPIELATRLLCAGRTVGPGMPADLVVWIRSRRGRSPRRRSPRASTRACGMEPRCAGVRAPCSETARWWHEDRPDRLRLDRRDAPGEPGRARRARRLRLRSRRRAPGLGGRDDGRRDVRELESLLEQGRPEAVLVLTPPRLHR